MKKDYKPKEIEDKWQKIWEESELYKLPDLKSLDKSKPKMHVLDMFPYPSGEGLHVGHSKIFTASDVYARMKRMQGYNVLHATGWDAFGLPAEQYAIKNKVNPKISTQKNIDTFRRQMKMLGLSYDWSREVNTTSPEFYKWTQWIFLKLWEKGLVKEVYEPINWCPSCKTGLANEDLEDGTCERCHSVVEKKPLRQYSIEITKYADKLLSGLDDLPWKENIKDLQRNWIGKSEGAEIDFEIKASEFESKFTIFTTRPDTLFGCTYCVLSPEHVLVSEMLQTDVVENKIDVEKYIQEVKNKTEIERTALGKEKTGVKLEGVYAINPANKKQVPVYIADYVLANYGTGAIMAVPAHDERDYEFAKKFSIQILDVPFVDVVEVLKLTGGKMVSKYKLRDWVFARQRYWGEPFPLVHIHDGVGNKNILTVDEADLPVLLPDVEDYEPTGTGESPLANIDEWVNVRGYITDKNTFKVVEKNNEEEFTKSNPSKEIVNAKRETNTMPQWAGSSWYWLRYMDPRNTERFVGVEEEKYFGQVDMYLGGLEHATRHLIYARFWHQFLYDIGELATPEPFGRLEAVGLVLAEGGSKMSKRSGNVINPDDIAGKWGVDTLRLYLLFMGPYHDSVSWNSNNLIGPRRFIERVWAMGEMVNNEFVDKESVIVELNKTIKKVTEDNEKLSYNTGVSQLMILLNTIEKENVYEGGIKGVSFETYKTLLKLLSVYCPFVTEEIWANLGQQDSIHLAEWPHHDEAKIVDANVKIAFQVNGKLRDLIEVPADSLQEYVQEQLLSNEMYKKWVTGSEIGEAKKVIFVKNKIINFIV
jgi:leucyl-tRNA synthetase